MPTRPPFCGRLNPQAQVQQVTLVANDADGDPVLFTAGSSDSRVQVSVEDNVLTVTPDPGLVGSSRITVVAHDGTPLAPRGRTATIHFDFSVEPRYRVL